eukprot:SAG31_NODE_1473_length_8207_cov_2.716330_1_plen_133_part_00
MLRHAERAQGFDHSITGVEAAGIGAHGRDTRLGDCAFDASHRLRDRETHMSTNPEKPDVMLCPAMHSSPELNWHVMPGPWRLLGSKRLSPRPLQELAKRQSEEAAIQLRRRRGNAFLSTLSKTSRRRGTTKF